MKDTNKRVQGYIASIPFDRRLYYQDIEGSIVYARMLQKRRIVENSALQTLFRMLMSSRYRHFWWGYVEWISIVEFAGTHAIGDYLQAMPDS